MHEPGTRLGPYVVERVLGTGSMAYVYAVRDPVSGRLHALKILPLASHEQRGRMMREADLQGRVRSESVVRLEGVVDVEGDPALLLEFIDGETLSARLAHGPLGETELRMLAADVAHGLDALHAAGLVHGDLKPSNILVSGRGSLLRAKISDFGIAREAGARTEPGDTVLGTPGYVPPEELRWEAEVGPHTDFYALGWVLLEAVGGPSPSSAIHPADLDHDGAQPWLEGVAAVPMSAPKWVGDVICRCLEGAWEARMSTAQEMLQFMSTEEEPPAGEETEVYRGDGEDDLRLRSVSTNARTQEIHDSGAATAPTQGSSLYASGWMLASMVVVVLILGALLWSRASTTAGDGEHVPLEEVLRPR